MLSNVETALRRVYKTQLQNKLLLGDKFKDNNYVFAGETGEPFWDTAIRVDMRKHVKRMKDDGIKIDYFVPHTFRHTFATRSLENGIKPKVLQTILGHSSLSMTMDIYSHVLPDEKEKEIKKLEAIV